MASDDMKEYRKDMALAVLACSLKPMTSGDIADRFAALAMAEGHPESCWRGVDASTINGYMQKMARAGLVAKNGEKRDSRAGRDVQLWSTALGIQEAPTPLPPTTTGVSRGSPATITDEQLRKLRPGVIFQHTQAPHEPSEFENHSRAELYALLGVHGELTEILFRHMRELTDWSSRARTRLAAAGLDSSA